jgi:hypothetical protein
MQRCGDVMDVRFAFRSDPPAALVEEYDEFLGKGHARISFAG